MLLARLATKKAKPDGQYSLGLKGVFSTSECNTIISASSSSVQSCLSGSVHYTAAPPHSALERSTQSQQQEQQQQVKGSFFSPEEEVKSFLKNLPLSQLPGVGYKLEKKLQEKGLLVCSDVWGVRKDSLKVFFILSIIPSPHFVLFYFILFCSVLFLFSFILFTPWSYEY